MLPGFKTITYLQIMHFYYERNTLSALNLLVTSLRYNSFAYQCKITIRVVEYMGDNMFLKIFE